MLSPRFLQMECNLPASTGNNPTSPSGSTSKPNNKSKMEKKKISKGVKLSTDPQSVAARERRHRISDRFKILQSMVPGGNKMDTVSMLEEAIHYVKFLKTQIWLHQTMINFVDEDQSPCMFLPQDYNVPSQDTTNYFQQQNPLVEANSGGDPLQSLPVLAQSCFQGEDITPSFEANVKYWPA